jgi:hypothetical protein
VGGAQVVGGVTAAALAAQPLSVDKVGAGQVGGDRCPAQAGDRLGVEVLGLAGVAGDQGPAPGEDAQPPVRPAAADWARSSSAFAATTGLVVRAAASILGQHPRGNLSYPGVGTVSHGIEGHVVAAEGVVLQGGGAIQDGQSLTAPVGRQE